MEPTHEQAQAAFGAPAPVRRGPSAAGYWLGGVLIAAGIAGAIAWFVAGIVSFADAVDDLQRVPLPGVATVRLDDGPQSVYYERPETEAEARADGGGGTGGGFGTDGGNGVDGGAGADGGDGVGTDADDGPPPPRVRVQVVAVGGGGGDGGAGTSGEPLRVGPHGGSVSYSTGGRHGQSIAGFDTPRAGLYRVTASAVDERLQAGDGLAIGRGVGRRIVRALVGAFVVFLLGAAAGTVLIIVTYGRRARVRAAP